MKIHVNLKTVVSDAAHTTFTINANPFSLVKDVAENALNSRRLTYHKYNSVHDGVVMDPSKLLSDYNVKDCDFLDIVLDITLASLTNDLEELLQRRDLSFDELSLLFCYTYGLSVTQAFDMLGVNITLRNFIEKNKTRFTINGGRIGLADGRRMPPLAAANMLKQLLEEHGPLTIDELSEKFTSTSSLDLYVALGSVRLKDFLMKHPSMPIIVERGVVSLRPPRSLETSSSSNDKHPAKHWRNAPPSHAKKATTPASMFDADARPPKKEFRPKGASARGPVHSFPYWNDARNKWVWNEKQEQELNNDSPRSFAGSDAGTPPRPQREPAPNSGNIDKQLDKVANMIVNNSHLNIKSVQKDEGARSCGRIVFGVLGLPSEKATRQWQAPLLKSVKLLLEEKTDLTSVEATRHVVKACMPTGRLLELSFRPEHGSSGAA